MAFLALGMTANAETVTSTNDDNKNSVIDMGSGADDNDRWSMHFSLGVDVPTDAPKGMDFDPLRSWEIGWTVAQYDYRPKSWNTTFSAGLGFNWRNFTLKGHRNMFAKIGDQIVTGPTPAGYEDLWSSVHVMSISMPLLVKQYFSRSFAISLGAQLNWNCYGTLNNTYEVGDSDYDVDTKKIGQRPFTIDFLGIVHYKKLGVYCKYSPMSVLKKDRGPEFKSLSFGIYF